MQTPDASSGQSPASVSRAAYLAARDAEVKACCAVDRAREALAKAEGAHRAAAARLAEVRAPFVEAARKEAEVQGAVFVGEEGARDISEMIECGRGYVRAWIDDNGLCNGIWSAFLWDGGCNWFHTRRAAEEWVRARSVKVAA